MSNPFSIAPVEKGAQLLDVGCGAGIDLFVASRLVGDDGRVFGVDLTKEMVQKSQELVTEVGSATISVQQISSEELPFDDNSFDNVTSNGVFNLSPSKSELFREIRRVLKPGGCLHFADIVLVQKLPPTMATSLEGWSQ